MLIVGLYHQCPGDENVTQSSICQAAVDYAYQNKKLKWNVFLKDRKYDLVGDLLTMKDIDYQVINFCGIKLFSQNTGRQLLFVGQISQL